MQDEAGTAPGPDHGRPSVPWRGIWIFLLDSGQSLKAFTWGSGMVRFVFQRDVRYWCLLLNTGLHDLQDYLSGRNWRSED